MYIVTTVNRAEDIIIRVEIIGFSWLTTNTCTIALQIGLWRLWYIYMYLWLYIISGGWGVKPEISNFFYSLSCISGCCPVSPAPAAVVSVPRSPPLPLPGTKMAPWSSGTWGSLSPCTGHRSWPRPSPSGPTGPARWQMLWRGYLRLALVRWKERGYKLDVILFKNTIIP